jgi:tetratricopeptide (TPR) repeat protein
MTKPKVPPKKQSAPAQNALCRKSWLLAGLLVLITFLIFSPSLKYDFVNWDDDVNVFNNANVVGNQPDLLKSVFTSTVIGGYTPLTTLSFVIEHRFVGLDPHVYHQTNVLLHLMCTVLVFFIFRELGLSLLVSFVVALLFGIHPMRVESVAWVTERKDVLYGAFYLLSLLSYVRYRKTQKISFFILTLGAFVLSLLSKIQAVSLPLGLIMIDFFFEKKFTFKQWLNKIPFFALSLVFGIMGIYFLKQEGSLETNAVLPFFQRVFIGSYSLMVYLIKAVFPYQMSAIYPYPAKLNSWHYLSMVAVLALAFLVFKLKRFKPEVVFGSLFFFVNVVFMLQIVGAGQGFVADRFTYIPYIGLFFVFAILFESSLKTTLRTPLVIGGIGYLLVLGALTWNRVPAWQDSETLFTDVIGKYPNVAVAHNNLGKYYREHNKYDLAIKHYDQAIAIDPNGFKSYSNRGKAYFDLGQVDRALADLNKSLAINGGNIEALSNRGAIWGQKGKLDSALIDLDKAIELDPRYSNAYSNRALVYYSLKEYEKVIQDVNSFMRIVNEQNADMINLRALANLNLNKNQEALNDYNLAIQLNPRQGVFFQNRSYLLSKLGDKKNALSDILKAQQLGVNVNPQYINFLKQP